MAIEDWLPTTRQDTNGWRLDIVSLLAVIGEASMAGHAQPMTASWLCYLPRIIPAPQALLKSNRPTRMPVHQAQVVGVKSGNLVPTLNYFANLIHHVEDVKAFECRVFEVKHTFRAMENDAEALRFARLAHGPPWFKKLLDTINPRQMNAVIPTAHFSPLNVLTVLSFLFTWGLFVWSVLIKDGVACLALITISLASSVIGLASRWDSVLLQRTATVQVPDGDVVIRTREGAFVIVKCTEEVARELYVGTEECSYKVGTMTFQALVGVGTFLLMVSVVLLGNCGWTMQLSIGLSYIVLNGAYWVAALLPKTLYWDLGRYNVIPRGQHQLSNYTETLWHAIHETQEVAWIRVSGAAPSSSAWDAWIEEANTYKGNKSWDAVGAKDRIIKRFMNQERSEKQVLDLPFVNEVPAKEVPPEPRYQY
jgi:hypothetical protein